MLIEDNRSSNGMQSIITKRSLKGYLCASSSGTSPFGTLPLDSERVQPITEGTDEIYAPFLNLNPTYENL